MDGVEDVMRGNLPPSSSGLGEDKMLGKLGDRMCETRKRVVSYRKV